MSGGSIRRSTQREAVASAKLEAAPAECFLSRSALTVRGGSVRSLLDQRVQTDQLEKSAHAGRRDSDGDRLGMPIDGGEKSAQAAGIHELQLGE
jgi:hypothetical protein